MVGANGFEPSTSPNHGSQKSKLLDWLKFPCAALSLTALRFAIRMAVLLAKIVNGSPAISDTLPN
jgi:hypothetical protein